MKEITYLITNNEDWENLYMVEAEDDFCDDESQNDDVETIQEYDEPLYERCYDNHIIINSDTGTFYLDGLDGRLEHIAEESEGVFHFTFEADADNDEATHFGRGWIKPGDNPQGKIYVHDGHATSFNLEVEDE